MILHRLACVAGLIAALPMASRAQPIESPPPGFEPLRATNMELARYGLPVRPAVFGAHGQKALAAWTRAMSAARIRVEPVFRIRDRRHGPVRPAAISGRTAAGPASSYNWAGQMLLNGITAFNWSSYAEVMGEWVVPSVLPPPGQCGQTFYSSIWVGIDGYNSADVFQGGTEQDATCGAGGTSTSIYPWVEWYPAYEQEITNFPIGPGTPVFVVVRATSPSAGQIVFINLQTTQYVVAPISAPSGTQLTGGSAEWILEKPNVQNAAAALADFGMAMISSEIAYPALLVGSAYYNTPLLYGPGITSDTVTMVSTDNQVLASPAVLGESAQLINAAGPTN